jgi:AcrR family transcriptional regulator
MRAVAPRSSPTPPRSKALTIADLVAVTEVPPATIHYYLRLGLVPPPKRISPNRFTYDERHVQALRLVRLLRDRRGLSLDMIRRIMPELLRLEAEEAFRPEMWDRALAPRLSRRRTPSQRLLEAAKDAFGRRGYDDVNVDDICRAARIAKGSFYRHYRSKEELFFAAVEATANDLCDEFAQVVGMEPVAVGTAGELMAPLLEPRLPIFLDLFARSLQRHAGYPAASRKVFGAAVGHIGRHVEGDGAPEERGARVFGAAFVEVFRRSMQAPDVAGGAPPVPLRLR